MADERKKLRITFVIPHFYPAWEYGGQPRAAYELARALAERGHQVKVLTTDSGGGSRLSEAGSRLIDGIDVVYYRNLSNRLAYRYRLFWPSQMFRDIAKEIAQSDLIHIHELRSTTSVLAYRAARRSQIPYVLSGHGGLRRLGRPLLKIIYDAIWGRRILRDAAAVIAVSPRELQDAKDMGVLPNRIRLVPNVVRSDEFQTLPAAGLFRERWAIPSGPIVLFLGRLHPLKGADLLVQAFSQLSKHHSTAILAIAGPDDGQEAELRRMISKLNLNSRVRVTGFLNLEAKKEAFVDAAVVAIPSRSEVFALTAVEALICGKPVLLSSACGMAPLPDEKGSVTFFETERVTDLTNKLQQIVEHNEPFAQSAHDARLIVNQTFSPAGIASRAEIVYREMVSQQRTR